MPFVSSVFYHRLLIVSPFIAYEYFAELLRQKNLGNEGSNE